MRNKSIATSLVLAVAAGCSPNVGTIDRTQPNAVSKTQFQGLWYIKQTIVDTQPGTDGAVEGYSSDLEKIRWEIGPETLTGYRSYEFMPYAEGLTDQGRDFFGSPVVQYRIQHFDIQRGYNTTTGVQNNTIVENTTDRAWYDREYIRVDWASNTVGTNFATGWGSFDGNLSTVSHAAYSVNDDSETETNRPFFTKDYFDVTNRYLVEPDTYYCYYTLLYTGTPRCGAQNVNVRLSFLKVDPADDYQTLYYPDNVELKDDSGKSIVVDFNGKSCGQAAGSSDGRVLRDPGDCHVATFPYFEAFGNFRINRIAFDKERYLTRSGRIYLAGRHNLWENSFNDTTGLPLEYKDRTPKPVIYYGNVDFPEDIIPGGKKIGEMWDQPFTETVAVLQGMTTAEGRGDIAKFREKYPNLKMFEFRQNDCNVKNAVDYARANNLLDVVDRVAGSAADVARGNVEKVCAAMQFEQLKNGATLDAKEAADKGVKLAFTWQREGDVRYSFQNYVNVDQPGPWGVAQFSNDPETGEYLSVAANYFGNAGDLISQREVDRIQWLNGDLNEETLLRGDVTRNVIASRRSVRNNSIRSDAKAALMESDAALVDQMGDAMVSGAGGVADSGDARFARMFKGTDIERELLVNDEILRGFAGPGLYQPANGVPGRVEGNPSGGPEVNPGQVSDEALAAASPVNWGTDIDSNTFMNDVRKLGGRGIEFAAFFDAQTSGLANFFKGKDRDFINQWLRVELYAAVQTHEVGHTVGLRHNFGASMDPLNYVPEFWEGGWWNQAPTPGDADAGVVNRAAELKYASVMDYGFGVAQEGLAGIGPYDQAAVRFLYGELVDVWNPKKVSVPDPRKYGSFARRCGHDSSFWGFPFLMQYLHYKDIPSILATGPNDTRLDDLYREMATRVETNAAASGDKTSCTLFIADVKRAMEAVQQFDPEPGIQNVFGARMIVHAADLMKQERTALLNRPEYDDPSTPEVNEAEDTDNLNTPENECDPDNDGIDDCDQDHDGVANDIGGVPDYFHITNSAEPSWNNYLHRVDYSFCPDDFSGYSPNCQIWDYGANFVESVDAHIQGYDGDYIFGNFRRDRWSPYGWGESPRSYMARLESRRFFHMTNVFRYYLYTRRSAFAETPLYEDWAEAAYRGLNFLDRVLQTPEPGRHCLDTVKNTYVPERLVAGGCAGDPAREFNVGIGFGQGKYLNTAWTNEYAYKVNRIGVFYDKLAAIRQLTSSSGRFIRDLADLFDRRAFSLGYLRAYEDPMIQRFSALIRGDHANYRSVVVEEPNANGDMVKFVRYMPLFDEKTDVEGGSVFQSLQGKPRIEPSWSWTLQYQALGYAIANWSSIADSSPEFYRFTKIALQGTPEDIEYTQPVDGRAIVMETFTDPETRFVYRAPVLPARPPRLLIATTRAYQRGISWGIGADLLKTANALLTTDYTPKKTACDAARGTANEQSLCSEFEGARRRLNEHTGYLDIVRRFNRQAELP